MNKCDLKKCYECSKYETCELRFNTHAIPVLSGVILIGFLALVCLGLGLFFYYG